MVAPGARGVLGAEGRVGAVGAQKRGHLDHRPSPARAPARAGRRRRRPRRRADVPQRVAVLAVERRPIPRRHAAGARGRARARAREISTAKALLMWGLGDEEELELVRDAVGEDTMHAHGHGTS